MKMSKKTILSFFILYIVIVIILLTLNTSSSNIKIHRLIFGIETDKYIHTLMFVPFLVFCNRLYKRSDFFIHFFIGIFFASISESLHYFLPYRDYSIYDFYANSIGIITGSITYLFKKI